jgi:hypothetical protein
VNGGEETRKKERKKDEPKTITTTLMAWGVGVF